MPEPTGQWNAHWISLSADPREDLGVFGFRRAFDLAEVPTELKVRVSADQRYKLYVNGEFVGFGPQRGDPDHWFYETYDLAPHLKRGKNWIAALVWNFGRWAPMAQMSARTGFVLEGLLPPAPSSVSPGGKTKEGESISTPGGWQVARLPNWDFDMLHSEAMNFYIDIGPGEIIDFRGAPWGWRMGEDSPPPPFKEEGGRGVEVSEATHDARQTVDSQGAANLIWRKPNSISRAEDRGTMGGGTPWSMVPRSIPPMLYEERPHPPKVRRGFTGDAPDPTDLKQGAPLNPDFTLLPDHPYLFDYGELLTAYPRLTLSGPPGTVVTLTYAEGLWRKEGGKGNRDQVNGKKMSGYQDRLILDGVRRTIEPLWWRTYRYLMIEAKSPSLVFGEAENEGGVGEGDFETTSDERRSDGPEFVNRQSSIVNSPIVLHSLAAIETGYPLKEESSFTADDPSVQPIWDVSIRTAKRCAGETYFDCPYYEQLQYVGDTRIQALIGYYLGRDRQLTRNAVETLGWSLMENGLTQSRYPTRQTQVIPPFSLWWVMMLWDQLLYDSLVPGEARRTEAETIERWFRDRHQIGGPDDEFWCFADWVPDWGWGVPPEGVKSPIHRLTTLLVMQVTHRLIDPVGAFRSVLESMDEADTSLAVSLLDDMDHLGVFTQFLEKLFPITDGLVRGKGGTTPASEHCEALYRIAKEGLGKDLDPWPTEALAKANAAKCTYYFSYYKHLAMFGRPEHEEGDKADKSYKTYKAYPFDYLTELQPWKEMIEQGLSTFAENPEPTRSDCHAWSAHPILGFFQIVAGVTSTAPGWKKARIMPHPGSLKRFDANIAHPDGNLQVKFEAGKLEIDSPVPFELRWKGKREEMKAGRHEIGK